MHKHLGASCTRFLDLLGTKEKKTRPTQNGGILLQLLSGERPLELIKKFTADELKKSPNNYGEDVLAKDPTEEFSREFYKVRKWLPPRSLAVNFVSSVKEDRLVEILDNQRVSTKKSSSY